MQLVIRQFLTRPVDHQWESLQIDWKIFQKKGKIFIQKKLPVLRKIPFWCKNRPVKQYVEKGHQTWNFMFSK